MSPRMTCSAASLCLTVACFTLAGVAPSSLWADVFHLRSGGQVRGKWLNREDTYAREFEIATATGVQLRIRAADVASRERESAHVEEYERLAPCTPHTIDDQWRMAQWCLERGLKEQRKTHLANILQLDADHAGARHALGYVQIENRWQTSAEFHEREGYARSAGRWKTGQDVQLQTEKKQQEQIDREWLMKLKRWRADLNSEKAAIARQQFESLADPQALAALQRIVRDERDPRLMPLYFDVLARMNSAAARQVLLSVTLSAASYPLFLEGCERVVKLPAHELARPLLDALRSSDNEMVNRGAYLMGKTQNATLSAPLIEALVTTRRVATGNNPSQTTSSFGGDGSIGLSRGAPAVVELPVQNGKVLDALIALTGQNFGYDQRAWRLWYDIEKDRILNR